MEIRIAEKALVFSGWMATLSAAVITAADYLLEFTTSLQGSSTIIEPFWLEASPWRFSLSLSLCCFFIPFYLAGFFLLYCILRQTHPRLALWILLLSCYGVIMGSPLIHGVMSLHPLIYSFLHGSPEAGILITEVTTRAVLPVFLVHYLITWVLSPLLLFGIIASGRSLFPRWFVLINPLVFLILGMALHRLVPSIGIYLYPGSINKANCLLFLLVTLRMRNSIGTQEAVVIPSRSDGKAAGDRQ